MPSEFLNISQKQQKITLLLYRLLAKGNAVSRHQLAKVANVTLNEVDKLLEYTGGVQVDSNNKIIGYWGLSNQKMDHRFIVDNVDLSVWCAWDALFLPGILNKTAEVYSICPVSKEEIYLKISPDIINEVKPASTVISFIKPDVAKIREDVVINFCHSILFFKSEKEAQQWVELNSGTFVLSLNDAFKLAQIKNQTKYSLSLASALK